MPHVITAAAPAICTPTFRRQIFPRRRRAILSIYLYAHFGNSKASQSGLESWALVNVARIAEMDALFPIIGFFSRIRNAAPTPVPAAVGDHDVVWSEPVWQ